MSTFKIQHDFVEEDVCAICVNIQLTAYREKIKEQFNEIISDGKTGIRKVLFQPSKDYLWESPITMVGGELVCLTHFFLNMNKVIENMKKGPSIQPATGSMDGFLKR